MGEPRAITYKEVNDPEVWRKINEVTGAGALAHENSSIDITGADEKVRAAVDKLVKKKADKEN